MLAVLPTPLTAPDAIAPLRSDVPLQVTAPDAKARSPFAVRERRYVGRMRRLNVAAADVEAPLTSNVARIPSPTRENPSVLCNGNHATYFGCSTLSLADLCDDALFLVIAECSEDPVERYRVCSSLAMVGKSLRATTRSAALSSSMAKEACQALLSRTGGCSCSAAILPLSGGGIHEADAVERRRIGTLECKLVALALSQGLVPPAVHSIWLQNNDIQAPGLRWLARGLRSMPASNDAISSISLGQNAFHAQLGSSAVRRALEKLEDAAAARSVKIRLHS